MRSTILIITLLAALLTPPAQPPRLFASLTRAAGPIVYADQRITLTVQVATDSAAPLNVFAYLDLGDGLRQPPAQGDAQARQCKNDIFEHFACTLVVDAAHPRVLAFDAIVRERPPGPMSAMLEVWPIALGRSALLTNTLTLTVIDPAQIFFPIAR